MVKYINKNTFKIKLLYILAYLFIIIIKNF